MNLKDKTYISSVSFIGVISLLIIFVIYPLFSNIKEQSQEFISQKNYYLELQIRDDNFQGLKKFNQMHQQELAKIDYLLIDPDKPIDFNIFLEKTAQDSNLQIKISNVQIGKPEANQWNFLNYQLTLIGSFINLTRFLDKLENSSYLVETVNLNIRESEETENIRADIFIKVYTK